ncbi:hypothetical protein [Pseudolactococcus reticulitermitis]|uniref:Uncharacterized protein n=1 Tax=Pseudolactococcus reticulitermitis TaxID=2025039 RepID=A0A224XG56_9LACT|nr:hypothetical protein [Lactococcus reticulitermitis]GAX48511.1 hypothetical protein RsY01_2140 [Lactococcus reticulitermitis]
MENIEVFKQIYFQLESEVLKIAYQIALVEKQKNVYSVNIAELQLRIFAQIEAALKYQGLKKGFSKQNFDNYIPKIPELKLRWAYVTWSNYHFDKKLYKNNFIKSVDRVRNVNENGIPITDSEKKNYKFNNAYQNLKHDFTNSLSYFGTLEYLFESLSTLFIILELSNSKIFTSVEYNEEKTELTGWQRSYNSIRKSFPLDKLD